MIYLSNFKLSSEISSNPNIYPDHVFKHMSGEALFLIELRCSMAATVLANPPC